MRSPVVTLSPGASMGQAAERMNDCGVGRLPVAEGRRLVGIVTSRNVRAFHPNRLVADAMSVPVRTLSPKATVLEAHALLARHAIAHLLVMDGASAVGAASQARGEAEGARYIDPLTELPRPELVKEQAGPLLPTGHKPRAARGLPMTEPYRAGSERVTTSHTAPTTRGSNWLPEQRRSSSKASSGVRGGR